MSFVRADKKANKPKNLPTSEPSPMLVRSPKFKGKHSRENMQPSSEQRSFDVIDANEDEERVSIYSPDPSPIISPNVSSIPSTHFTFVLVSMELDNISQFFNGVMLNKNMVVTSVAREFMTRFMPGDQISSANDVPIWNRSQLEKELCNLSKRGSQKIQITFSVIRAWNLTCLTENQLSRLSPPPDERLHYFSVKIFCKNRAAGLYLRSEKKRLLVSHIRSKTAISFGLLVGDQLLGINDEMLVGIRTKALYKQAKELMLKARKLEFTEIIACRPVLVRSSPAPSVDAELAMKSSATKGGLTEQANKPKEKTVPELSSLPLEADALEISLRELTLLQQWIRTDSPLPTCEKGNSLLRFNSSQGDQSSRTSEKSEYTGTATTDAPRKRGILFRKRSQPTITFTEQLETSKVTSDISEEAELKKCDPRSGIVSYIKNAFNN